MDAHCDLKGGQIFHDYNCLLNQVDKKSDKFYLIQLLFDDNGGYFIYTRWGKNGSTSAGQTKLEGPTAQSDAETLFKKKFYDKTKNKWENRHNFTPENGKYTMVLIKPSQSTSRTDSIQVKRPHSSSELFSMDEHCELDGGQIFQNYHCLLTQVDKKSDKFYMIQLLTDDNGEYFIYTRWGKNGTTGQTNLEGPIKLSNAEKSFKRKFHDKTKNKWEDRSNFVPVNGKYMYSITSEDAKSTNNVHAQQTANIDKLVALNDEKPDFPNTDISDISLPADVLCEIMSYLETKDVLKCMQVCKFWQALISEKYLWKMLIYRHFDLSIKSGIEGECEPFISWSDPEEWFSYFDNEDDRFVFRPFPSLWKCGVIHPFGLDPMAGDVKSLQGFLRSLEILTYMKNKTRKYNLCSGNECSGNEGCHDISVVLFPWNGDDLPSGTTVLTEIFHVHPEISDNYSDSYDMNRTEMLFYHLPEADQDEEEYEELLEHDLEERPCLNRIFGFTSSALDEGNSLEEIKEFYTWLQKIMVPSGAVYAGIDKMNPVIVFFLTKLAPGWVGGALTGVVYT